MEYTLEYTMLLGMRHGELPLGECAGCGCAWAAPDRELSLFSGTTGAGRQRIGSQTIQTHTPHKIPFTPPWIKPSGSDLSYELGLRICAHKRLSQTVLVRKIEILAQESILEGY
jgi:hypothetical protein